MELILISTLYILVLERHGKVLPRIIAVLKYLIYGDLLNSVVKNLPAMQETQKMRIRSLDSEDPLEEEMATHSSILAWKILWIEQPIELQYVGLQGVRHN